MSTTVWLPSTPDEVIHLLSAQNIARGLEFSAFWINLIRNDQHQETEEWAKFVASVQGKAIVGAEEHGLEGFMYDRPSSYWVRELKDEVKDMAAYGAFALWAAAGHPTPRAVERKP